MIRLPREALNVAIEQIMVLCTKAGDSQGRLIGWRPDPAEIEKALLAMLSTLTPSRGPDIVIPEDVWHSGMETNLPPVYRIGS